MVQPKKNVKELFPLLKVLFLSLITCKIEIFLLNQKKNNLLKKKKSRKKLESFIANLLKTTKFSKLEIKFLL
jgi:hypothetical protein